MLRQATLNETYTQFRSFNPPNAEAGDVGRLHSNHLGVLTLPMLRQATLRGDVGPNVTHTLDSNHLRDTPTASLLTLSNAEAGDSTRII